MDPGGEELPDAGDAFRYDAADDQFIFNLGCQLSVNCAGLCAFIGAVFLVALDVKRAYF